MRRDELMDIINNSHACGLPSHVDSTRLLAEEIERLQREVRELAAAYENLAIGRHAPNRRILLRIQGGEFG